MSKNAENLHKSMSTWDVLWCTVWRNYLVIKDALKPSSATSPSTHNLAYDAAQLSVTFSLFSFLTYLIEKKRQEDKSNLYDSKYFRKKMEVYAEHIAGESADESANESANESADESADELSDESADELSDELADELIILSDDNDQENTIIHRNKYTLENFETVSMNWGFGYWILWYANWVITGAATALNPLFFIAPLLYAFCLSTSSNDNQSGPSQADKEFFKSTRKYFINVYFNKKIHDSGLEKLVVHNSPENISAEISENSEISEASKKIASKKSIKHKIGVGSAFFNGVVFINFIAWPIGILATTAGFAGLSSPVGIITIAILSFIYGVYKSVLAYNKKDSPQHDADNGSLKALETLREKNNETHKALKIKIAEYNRENADHLFNLDIQDRFNSRFLRRMEENRPTNTALKKVANRGYAFIAAMGSGMMMARMFFSSGCLLAITNPYAFVAAALVIGILWATLKVYEYNINSNIKELEFTKEHSDLFMLIEKRREAFLNLANASIDPASNSPEAVDTLLYKKGELPTIQEEPEEDILRESV